MLPPVAPNVLEANPKFATLYKNLAGSRLNPDASTRLIKQQRAQIEIEKQLITARTQAAQRVLLQDALRSVAERMHSDLPPELIETCHIISTQLDNQLSPSDLSILADDIDKFLHSIPQIASILSIHLTETTSLIAQLLSSTHLHIESHNTEQHKSSISNLIAQATTLATSLHTQQTSLLLNRTTLTFLSTHLHSTYTSLLETSIRLLELTLHGSLSRATRAHAEHLAIVAKGLELKVQIIAQTDTVLTDPGLKGELEGYRGRLERLEGEMRGRVAEAEAEFGGYERAGRGMKEIARRFVEVKGECEAVRLEIAKLEERR